MKTSVKSTIIIIVTLLIGMAIGFEFNEIVFRGHFKKIRDFRRPAGFMNFFEDVIKPDEKQKKEIEPIIMKYHQRTESVVQNSFKQVDLIMDSLKAELKPKISAEQYKRLEERFERMKKRGAGPDRKGPPPPPM